MCVYECVMEWRYGCVCMSVWWNGGMGVCVYECVMERRYGCVCMSV